jgi:hypothetical protein
MVLPALFVAALCVRRAASPLNPAIHWEKYR